MTSFPPVGQRNLYFFTIFSACIFLSFDESYARGRRICRLHCTFLNLYSERAFRGLWVCMSTLTLYSRWVYSRLNRYITSDAIPRVMSKLPVRDIRDNIRFLLLNLGVFIFVAYNKIRRGGGISRLSSRAASLRNIIVYSFQKRAVT